MVLINHMYRVISSTCTSPASLLRSGIQHPVSLPHTTQVLINRDTIILKLWNSLASQLSKTCSYFQLPVQWSIVRADGVFPVFR